MMDNFCLFCVVRGERNFSEPGSGAKRKGNDTKVRACFFWILILRFLFGFSLALCGRSLRKASLYTATPPSNPAKQQILTNAASTAKKQSQIQKRPTLQIETF